jgi:cytochrome c oxidase subunit 2
VKLIMTSRDFIHSFFVPDFRIKMDVLPGRYTVAWFEAKEPGTHQLLCTEFCGTGHSTMRGEIVVLSAEDYARWLEGEKDESAEHGKTIFEVEKLTPLAQTGQRVAGEQGCLRCHTSDGAPHIGPTWRAAYGAKRELADGTSVIVDEAYLTESMMDPRARIVKGFQPVMPTYHGRLQPAETAAIVEFIKSLRGNQ